LVRITVSLTLSYTIAQDRPDLFQALFRSCLEVFPFIVSGSRNGLQPPLAVAYAVYGYHFRKVADKIRGNGMFDANDDWNEKGGYS
jgi:hypothetical protein